MECQICQVRSAVGRCEETNQLVCEECSIDCYRCGKRIASTAGHETKSGHVYCTPCYKERAARHAARRAGVEGAAAEGLIEDRPARRTGVLEEEAPPEEVIEEEAVLARWEPPAPWKMSLYLGLVGIALSVFFLLFPGYRVIPITAAFSIRLGFAALFLALIGIAWAVVGIVGQRYEEQRTRSYIGLGLAVVAGILAVIVAVKPRPLSADELALQGGSRPRQFESDTERQAWREQFLGGNRAEEPKP